MQLLLFVSLIGIVAVVKGDSSSTSSASSSLSSSSSGSGTGTVTVATATSATVCMSAANPCVGTLRLCKNTATPASSGQCGLFAATSTFGVALSFTYENAITPSISVTCPGTCFFSAVQTTYTDGVASVDTEATSSVVVTGSTTFSTTLTTIGGFTIPVSGTINCSDD